MFKLLRSSFIASIVSSLAVASLPLALQGCAFESAELEGDDQEFAQHDDAITNGWRTDAAPYAVRLNDSCTGTLISPHLVLTAAHCWHQGSRAYGVWVDTGPEDPEGSLTHAYYDGMWTTRVTLHPNFRGTDADGNLPYDRMAWDLALVRLNGQGLPNIPPARIYAGPETPWTKRGERFYAVGYGIGSDAGGAQDCSNALPAGSQRIGGFHATGGGYQVGSTWHAFAAYQLTRTGCPGDSGGPFLLQRNGEFFQFAVASASYQIHGQNVYGALVEPKMTWIIRASRDMGITLSCTIRNAVGATPVKYHDCQEVILGNVGTGPANGAYYR